MPGGSVPRVRAGRGRAEATSTSAASWSADVHVAWVEVVAADAFLMAACVSSIFPKVEKS